MKLISLALYFLISHSAVASTLQTHEGVVIGSPTATGDFYPNIPFAQPPVANLRWKAPRAPLPRTKIWDGSQINVKCAQTTAYFSGAATSADFGKPTGSEDCLYLNIWRPKSKAKKLPVFVWFHGGSNRQGYASDPLYRCENLAAQTDAIVVTVNYRLGILGALMHDALKTEDRADSSGNFVTLDMLQALTWVRANIETLGGDVDRLTVGGQSAGCMNVWGLIQSPLAKGLFNQAYCSSGFPNNYPTTIAHESADDIIQKALVLKKKAANQDDAAKLLKTMSGPEIKTFLYALSTEEILSISPSFIPIQHIADGYVLPGDGLLAIMAGSYNSVPMMVNSNSAEGSFFFLQPLAEVSKIDFWKMLIGETSAKPIEDLMHSFPRLAKFKEESANFTYGMNQLIDSILVYRQWTPGAIYRMRFEWTPQSEPWHTALGACHGIDLPFLFHETNIGPNHYFSFLKDDLKDPATLRLSDRFLTYFKGFLHTGDPNSETHGLPTWSQWSGVLPNNMTFSHDDIRNTYHYVSPLVGTYSLMTSIYELQKATEAASVREP